MALQVVVPQLGESVVEARVGRWLKQEGDTVAIGDPLVELETEKIDLEVNADQAGVLSKILRQEGEDVQVGEALGEITPGAAGAGAPAAAGAEAAGKDVADAPAAPNATAATGPGAPADATTTVDAPRSTPTARNVAEAHQVDLATVQGSGDSGRVLRRDVEAAVQQQPAGA